MASVKFSFEVETRYLDAWTFLMRQGLGFRYTNELDEWSVEVDLEQPDLMDESSRQFVLDRLAAIRDREWY